MYKSHFTYTCKQKYKYESNYKYKSKYRGTYTYNYEFKSSYKSIYNRFKTDLIISFKYMSFFAIIFSIFIFLKKLLIKFSNK